MEILSTELIAHEILTRLPMASLLRFKCVSKSYNALISSPEFIDLHLRRSLSYDSNHLLILLTRNPKQLYLLDLDSPDPVSKGVKLVLPYTLDKLKQVSVLSSFNGLLCLGLRCSTNCGEIVLINPSTRMYRSIPRANCTPREKICWGSCFGLGFDDINKDYKLVRVTVNHVRLDPFEIPQSRTLNREVKVYSLKENTWKLVEDVDGITGFLLPGHQNGVVLKNHLLHWVFGVERKRYRICCFDVRLNEWTTEVPMISNNATYSDRWLNLGVLDGCLCLSTRTYLLETVWVMKKYGVQESWVKLFDIPVATFESFFGPFGFRKQSKHEVLIQVRNDYIFDKLYWCDTRPGSSSRRTEEITWVWNFDQVFYFKASLVAIPNGHRIKE